MFFFKKQKGKTYFPLKRKIILILITFLCVLSIINITSFFTLRSSISKLNNMINIIVKINSFGDKKELDTIYMTYGNIIADYNEENVASLEKYINTYKNQLSDIEHLIKDEEGKTELLGFSNLITDYITLLQDGIKSAEKKDFSKIQEISVEISSQPSFIIENAKNLVAIELKYFSSEIIKINKNIYLFGIAVVMIIIIIFILGIFISLIFSNMLVKPIFNVSNSLKEISEGGGDLTKKIFVKTRDEIRTLSDYFNAFVAMLGKMIIQIKDVTDKTRKVSSELAVSSQESTSALEEIRINITNMKNKSISVDEEVIKISKMSGEINDNMTEYMKKIDDQYSTIQDSSSIIENMNISIQELYKNSESKKEISNNLIDIASTGENIMNKMISNNKNIYDSANIIADILKVINNTSSQTNLLAMNASIEAAHAGENGKGFSVVAEEIRKLAEETGKNSKEISKSLKILIANMKTSEESTVSTGKIFIEMINGIKNLSTGINEILELTKKYIAKNSNLNESIMNLNKVTDEIKTRYASIENNMKSMTNSIETIKMISSENKNGMEEATIGINQIFTSSELVNQAGTKNLDNIKILEDLIDKFKI